MYLFIHIYMCVFYAKHAFISAYLPMYMHACMHTQLQSHT